MSEVGQVERKTQRRVIKLFTEQLGYEYLGNWKDREGNANIESELLSRHLEARGYEPTVITRALDRLSKAAAVGGGHGLYAANRAVYDLLRYGVKVRPGIGEQSQTVWLIDWRNPEANHFAIAEEVTVHGQHTKRPDVVLYVNGLALAIIELKRSTVAVSEGIRQTIGNQSPEFIGSFFSTAQLLFAGNEVEGLRYGVIGSLSSGLCKLILSF
jgi:type I restriction enzyme R subunit